MSSEFADLVLLLPFLLYLSGHRLFFSAVNVVSRVVFLPATVIYLVFSVSIRAIPKLVKGMVKAVGLVSLAMVLGVVYLLSSVVPFLGERTAFLGRWVGERVYPRYLILRVRRSRDMLVELIAAEDSRDLDFDEVEQYREALAEVKESGTRRLERGETVLSLALGALLIGSQAAGVRVFQVSMYGVPLSLLVELWLLVLAASIVYRVSVLEFLAYPEDTEFESIEEFDAALGYQKGVSLQGSFQVLFVLMMFIWVVSNVRDELVRTVLREKYSRELGLIEMLPFAWRELRSRK
jgi:hypothetical protein